MTKNEMGLFSRLINGVFGANAAPPVPRAPATEEVVVGRGAANEKLLSINGIPNLFVDEGDCVVQFEPAFDEELHDFADFGMKMLPDMTPHWSLVSRHESGMKVAVAAAIRSTARETQLTSCDTASNVASYDLIENRVVGEQNSPVRQTVSAPQLERTRSTVQAAPRREARKSGHSYGATRGTITGWGEEEFPRREVKPGEDATYTSFAMRLELRNGQERILQGEGLKDAIADVSAKIGDYVSVHRLRKVKVPAFNDDGTPKLRGGVQVEWDKWLWEIKR